MAEGTGDVGAAVSAAVLTEKLCVNQRRDHQHQDQRQTRQTLLSLENVLREQNGTQTVYSIA